MSLSFGRILGAGVVGALKGAASLAETAKEEQQEADKLYATKAEYARRKAEDNRDEYRKSLKDNEGMIREVSGLLKGVDGSGDNDKRNRVAAQLVKSYGGNIKVVTEAIKQSLATKGGPFTEAMVGMVIDEQMSIEDMARAITPNWTGYNKLKPVYTYKPTGIIGALQRNFGSGANTTTEELETERAEGQGLMSRPNNDTGRIKNYEGAIPIEPDEVKTSAYTKLWYSGKNNFYDNSNKGGAEDINTQLKLQGGEQWHIALQNAHTSADAVASSQTIRQGFIKDANAGVLSDPLKRDAYAYWISIYGGNAKDFNKYVGAAKIQKTMFNGQSFNTPKQLAAFIAKDRRRKDGPTATITSNYIKKEAEGKGEDFWKASFSTYFLLAPYAYDENMQNLVKTVLMEDAKRIPNAE
jgi:hypothetical protein